MSVTEQPADPAAAEAEGLATSSRGKSWIDHWEPEDPEFWESTGKPIAQRNLLFSIFAEHLGFSVWLLWSVSAALLAKQGFDFTPKQLFWLVAIPNLVGSLLRLPYTFAVPKFGGRNWTIMSASLLAVPTLLFAIIVQHPGTPFWVFMVVAALAGVGGGNFASSMASINFFYPTAQKGTALGLNAAGGNAGVAVIQFFLPIIVGGAGAFGLVKAGQSGIVLQRAGYLYAALAILAAVCAYLFMNNLSTAYSKPREQLQVVKYKHTWIMAFLYIGTFGSFIGYSAAMPLLIKVNFFRSPIPSASIGINFAYYAFLGALVGSVARPYGGWLADKYGGARVTAASFVGMIAGTVSVYISLKMLDTVPAPDPVKVAAWTKDPTSFPGFAPAVTHAVNHNSGIFPFFLISFLVVFVASGIGNGSAYRMIPAIWKTYAKAAGEEGTGPRIDAEAKATKEASAVLGIVGAVGAIGGFLIPITFNSPWVTDPVAATKSAFIVFTIFYLVCLGVAWAFYLKPTSEMAKAGV
ncbi:MAG TPA: nitrate/nitrite transporter [Marmoricola sp.]|jgi:NNP family nitrate/nitrite transporter-like MFS transporter|nr:nitrate/nitrite transporter [Marmoricola sp.]